MEKDKKYSSLFNNLMFKSTIKDDTMYIYAYKIIRVVISFIALAITANYMTELYLSTVITENETPPDLSFFALIFIVTDFVLNIFFLIMLDLLAPGASENIHFKYKQLKSILIKDYMSSISITGVLSYVLAMSFNNKTYFNYQEDGLKAIRALKDSLFYVSTVNHLVPFFQFYVSDSSQSNNQHKYLEQLKFSWRTFDDINKDLKLDNIEEVKEQITKLSLKKDLINKYRTVKTNGDLLGKLGLKISDIYADRIDNTDAKEFLKTNKDISKLLNPIGNNIIITTEKTKDKKDKHRLHLKQPMQPESLKLFKTVLQKLSGLVEANINVGFDIKTKFVDQLKSEKIIGDIEIKTISEIFNKKIEADTGLFSEIKISPVKNGKIEELIKKIDKLIGQKWRDIVKDIDPASSSDNIANNADIIMSTEDTKGNMPEIKIKIMNYITETIKNDFIAIFKDIENASIEDNYLSIISEYDQLITQRISKENDALTSVSKDQVSAYIKNIKNDLTYLIRMISSDLGIDYDEILEKVIKSGKTDKAFLKEIEKKSLNLGKNSPNENVTNQQ